MQRIAPAVSHAFFVDGYVRVKPDALRLLVAGLAATPDALAATGVPTMGRSAAALRASSGVSNALTPRACIPARPARRRRRRRRRTAPRRSGERDAHHRVR